MHPIPPVRYFYTPDGQDATRTTLRLMRGMVRAGRRHPAVRLAALDLTSGLAGKDWRGQIATLHAYVRDDVRYTRDIRGVETLQNPEFTLEWGQGDCDDKSILLSSLLESIGHPTRFVAVGYGPLGYQHVFLQTLDGDKWLSLETTEPVEVGWSPRRPARAMIQHV